MSRHKRRLERLEDLVGAPERPERANAHEKIRHALNRVALLRRRQGVAAEDLSLTSDEDREAWAIFEAGVRQAERGEG